MKKSLIKNLILQEVGLYKEAYQVKDLEKCKYHLGRAHIVSQKSILFHLYVHCLMLSFSIQRFDIKEVLGQVLRLAVTIPGHVLGKVPKGNTGWSNVGLTKEIPLPKDLLSLLKDE